MLTPPCRYTYSFALLLVLTAVLMAPSAQAQSLTYDPSFLDFGDTVVGEGQILSILVTNNNTFGTTVGTIQVVDFSLMPVLNSGFSTVVVGDPDLDPGESLTIQVIFEPTQVDRYDYYLEIDECSDACYEYIPLSGVGVFDLNPEALNFGEVVIGAPETQSITVTNPSSASITIDLLEILSSGGLKQGEGGGLDFSVEDITPFPLGPGASRNVNVTFDPLQPGLQEAELLIGINSQEIYRFVPLSGTGVLAAPEIEVIPLSLNFGTVFAGDEVVQTVEIENIGDADLIVDDISITGTGSSAYDTEEEPFGLAPGASHTIDVLFSPSVGGSFPAQLRISSNDPQRPVVTVNLSGNAALLEVDPTALDFGQVALGSQATLPLTLHNEGSTPIQVQNVSPSGANAGRYSVAPPLAFILDPGASRVIDVTFSPNEPRVFPARLIIETDVGSVEVPLSGAGTSPAIVVSESLLDFGEVPIGTSSTESFTITNDGLAPLLISDIGIAGGGGAFSITSGGNPPDLAAGETHTVAVTFTPTAHGPAAATLQIQSNDPDTPEVEVELEGEGLQALTLSDDELDFEEVRLGQSATLDLVVSNQSSDAITVTASIAGSTAFQVDNEGPFEIGQGDVTLAVTFSPAARGSEDATLTIQSDTPGQPDLIVALTGQGTAPRLVVEPAALTFGMALVDRTVEQTVTISNTGNAVLNVDAPVLSGADAAAFSLDDAGAFTVAPGAEHTITVQFQPPNDGDYSAAISLSTDDPDAPQVELPLTGQGASIDNLTQGLVDHNTEALVEFLVPEGLGNVTGELFYRMGGQTSFQQMAMTRAGDNLQATIPASAVTERGLQYRARLDVGGETLSFPPQSGEAPPEPFQIRVQVDALTAAVTLTPEAYQMVSVPLELEDASPASIFEDDFGAWNPAEWRLLRWNETANDYDEHPEADLSLTPGRAPWLITRTGTGFDVGSGLSTDVSGPYEVVLSPGWNQVGSPFAFPVAWASVQNRNQVQGLFAYDGTQFVPGQTVLVPWRGYFVSNETSGPVTLRIPAVAAQQTGKVATEPLFAEESYVMQLHAELAEDGLRDSYNYLGFSEHLAERRTALNLPEPPPVSSHLRLSVMDGAQPRMSLFKTMGGEGARWDLEVSAVFNGQRRADDETVTVRLAEYGQRPQGFAYYVFDEDLGRPLAVENNSFTVQLTSRHPVRHLSLLVGTEAFADAEHGDLNDVPDQFSLRQNYPNPFNPETLIRYSVAEQRHVVLEVYNLLGQRVQTLVNAEQAPGQYEVTWNGQDDRGEQVASGMYLYRLQAGSFVDSRRMVLLR